MAATVASSFPHLIRRRFPIVVSSRTHTPLIINFSLRIQTTSPHTLSLRSLFSTTLTRAGADDVASLDDDDPPRMEPLQNQSNATSSAGGGALIENSTVKTTLPPPRPSLSIKEKKELASHAHSLGKKLKSQQVGKSGVTDTVVGALIETLEANELLKIHNTCPRELEDVVKQLEETTGSVVVGQIGRTVILYRPSLSKMKAEEEKRKCAQRVYLKNQQALTKQSPQSKRPVPVIGAETRQSWCGRRGTSRS